MGSCYFGLPEVWTSVEGPGYGRYIPSVGLHNTAAYVKLWFFRPLGDLPIRRAPGRSHQRDRDRTFFGCVCFRGSATCLTFVPQGPAGDYWYLRVGLRDMHLVAVGYTPYGWSKCWALQESPSYQPYCKSDWHKAVVPC